VVVTSGGDETWGQKRKIRAIRILPCKGFCHQSHSPERKKGVSGPPRGERPLLPLLKSQKLAFSNSRRKGKGRPRGGWGAEGAEKKGLKFFSKGGRRPFFLRKSSYREGEL